MLVNCQIECVLCVDSFKTIDLLLLQEGMYQIRFCLYMLSEEEKIRIPFIPKETFQMSFDSPPRTSYHTKQQLPLAVHSTGFKDRKSSRKDQLLSTQLNNKDKINKEWVPAHILKEYNMFCSSAFLIRTWTEEEKIQVQNGCRFTASVPYAYIRIPLIMEVELMFNDLSNLNPKVAQFKCLSLAKFRISDISSGVYEYIPIIFGDDHFHLVNLSFYSTLTEYKFKTSKMPAPQNENPLLNYVSQIQSCRQSNQQQVKQLRDLYNTFVQPLRTSYQKLTEFHGKIETEVTYQERKSSSGGMSQLRQGHSKSSAQLLPVSCIDEIENNQFQQFEKNLSRRKSQQFNNSFQGLNQDQEVDVSVVIQFSKSLATEFQIVQSLMHQMWLKTQQLIKLKNHQIICSQKRESLVNQQMRFQTFVCKENIYLADHTFAIQPTSQKIQADQLECLNKRTHYIKEGQFLGPSKISDYKLLSEVKDKLVIFEKHTFNTIANINQNKTISFQQKGKLHLIIFVHGYQGHPYDMRLFESYLCLRYPQHMFMISISNQNCTEGDILKMGTNLAEEVLDFITLWCPENQLARLSFIGHSLGGLIIRAALPHLSTLSEKMFTILTLGSPHLGYVHNEHSLIKFGLWILQSLKKSNCIQQLTMKDAQKEDELLLMKLSKFQGLNWFKQIILLGSHQDHYVTSDSALIMKVGVDLNDVHNVIADNILRNFTQPEIIRVIVDFIFDNGDMDTFLGRRAHIAILESHFLIQYIIYNLGDYFR